MELTSSDPLRCNSKLYFPPIKLMYILQQKQWRRRQLFESFSANWRPKLTISAKFRKANISKNHQVRKKYTIQLGENELVLKELDLLSEDANVFKLIGPVLVKQDLAEARANVRKRIEYISAELKRLDATLQDLEEKQNSKKETMLKLQQRAQSLQAGKAKA
ncbi:hypothetical protein PRUPE_3G104900 [Prunus persica]|uniref:Prefoldin subunit 6 n=2 Tax=Prunus TaxID=3754 RepID=M5WR56_PRUPE|nr:hypothetical protein PRUPE_3G104900 [Prunus persica]